MLSLGLSILSSDSSDTFALSWEKIYIYVRDAGISTDTGIYRDKTMTDKLMYLPNDDTQNYPSVNTVSC